MIRSCSLQIYQSTKNHVFPTIANFGRNTKWLRCCKLYPKKKDEKTLVERVQKISSHGMNKYLTRKKNMEV